MVSWEPFVHPLSLYGVVTETILFCWAFGVSVQIKVVVDLQLSSSAPGTNLNYHFLQHHCFANSKNVTQWHCLLLPETYGPRIELPVAPNLTNSVGSFLLSFWFVVVLSVLWNTILKRLVLARSMSISHTQIQITQWTWNDKNLRVWFCHLSQWPLFIYYLFVFLNNAE